MDKHSLIITPKTKVGELLDNYPQLEEVLMQLSPAFAKLRNPVLRKTVARVASLQQAAVIGGVKTDELINSLRKEVGQDDLAEVTTEGNYLSDKLPEDFDEQKIVIRYDATATINSGESPMNSILDQSHRLGPGEIMELKTPFLPAPIIDMLQKKGYFVTSVQNYADEIYTYIRK